MSLTVSGVITASGTTLSGGTLVSGSHYVNYTYSYIIPSLSGSYVCADTILPSGLYSPAFAYAFPENHALLYTQEIGEQVGLSPLDLKLGLIAWHPFREAGDHFDDWSDNDYYAVNHGTVPILGRHGYGREVNDYPSSYGYVQVPTLPYNLSEYMCSFWFKPTETLTSGNTNCFTILSSEGFYGDHFGYSHNYVSYSPIRGWYLLNTTTTCSAGYGGTYLKMKGASNTTWSGSTWTSSTLYFRLNKEDNWSLDTTIKFDPLLYSQSLGVILFDRSSYLKYCSIVLENKGLEVLERVDLTPAMTSSTTPSGYSVVATSQYSSSYAPYKAFDHTTDAYGWCTTNTALPHSIYFGFPSGVYIDAYRFRVPNGATYGTPATWYLYGMTPYVVSDPDGANNPSDYYATPVMTSDTAPSPYVISASSEAYGAAYYAFNQTIAMFTGTWTTGATTSGWLKVDMGAGNPKVINKYRINQNATYQPQDWTIQASNNDVDYVVLETVVSGVYNPDYWTNWHTFVNGNSYRYYKINITRSNGAYISLTEWQLVSTAIEPSITGDAFWNQVDSVTGATSPGAGNWSPWYTVDSPSSYQYYKLKTTAVNSSNYVWIGEIELARLYFIPSPADIKVKTGTFSYTVGSDLTMPSSQATIYLKVTKNGNLVKFKYKDAYNDYWIEAPQELDCSTWSSGIAFGLQSHNLSGEAPEVLFDYVSFQRGIKPDIVGDAAVPGRFLLTYNETNVSGAVGPRSDSRIWLQSDYCGLAYGTATHYWDPDEWYLLQAGVKSTGEYCWWVNGRQERGLIVGSGNTIGNQFLTNSGVNYFDNSYPTSTSGSFILDEASHWDRWLTGEEILKMINKVSQSQWLYTEGYHSASLNLLSTYISVSGSVSERAISKELSFYYYGQYQSPGIPTSEIKFEKVSYRIQKDMIIVAQEIDPFVVNIARCSSGWMANQMGCFGCLTSSGGNRCQCLVYEEVSVYALGSKNFDYLLYQLPRTQTRYSTLGITPSNAVSTEYKQLIYDMTGPAISSVEPAMNSRLVDSNFEDYTSELGHVTIQDYGSSLGTVDTNRVWIKHSTQGHHSFITSDNFSFYEHDFRTNPSGYGWITKNHFNTTSFIINEGYGSTVNLDYGEVFPSGVSFPVTSSGIDGSLQVLRDSCFRFAPTCDVYGTNLLNITTESGSWCPGSTEQSAPYLYFLVPSGIDDWEIKTKLNVYRSGDSRGQYAGLMLWEKNIPQSYNQLLVTNSGVAWRSNASVLVNPPSLYTGLQPTDDIWIKYKKLNNQIYCYWSPNGTTWSGVNLVTQWESLVPAMSGFSNPPVYISSSSDATGYESWKAFDTTTTGTWWKGTNGAVAQWLMVDFTESKVVYAYRFATSPEYYDSYSRPLRGWMTGASFQGANNSNGPWTSLHSLTSPLDPGPAAFMPTASGYYRIERPSWYRYYRFYINSSTYVWQGGICCDISSIQLFGSTTLTTSGNRDFYVGPTLISDRVWNIQTNPVEAAVTSWSVSSQNASYPGSNAFTKNSNLYWRAGTTSLPQWIQATVSGVVKSYRIYFPNSTLKAWQLQGTNNGVNYTTLHSVADFINDASKLRSPTNHTFNIDNDVQYMNYRLYITQLQAGQTTAQVSDWRLYSTQSGTNQVLPARTSADFDYVHVSSSSGTGFTQIGDEWELLLDGITPLNSMDSSTYTSFTQVDNRTHRLSYRPLADYPKGEDIFVRVQSKDPATFKVDYQITPDTLLYLDCDVPSGIAFDSTLNQITASGHESLTIFDKSLSQTPTYNKAFINNLNPEFVPTINSVVSGTNPVVSGTVAPTSSTLSVAIEASSSAPSYSVTNVFTSGVGEWRTNPATNLPSPYGDHQINSELLRWLEVGIYSRQANEYFNWVSYLKMGCHWYPLSREVVKNYCCVGTEIYKYIACHSMDPLSEDFRRLRCNDWWDTNAYIRAFCREVGSESCSPWWTFPVSTTEYYPDPTAFDWETYWRNHPEWTPIDTAYAGIVDPAHQSGGVYPAVPSSRGWVRIRTNKAVPAPKSVRFLYSDVNSSVDVIVFGVTRQGTSVTEKFMGWGAKRSGSTIARLNCVGTKNLYMEYMVYFLDFTPLSTTIKVDFIELGVPYYYSTTQLQQTPITSVSGTTSAISFRVATTTPSGVSGVGGIELFGQGFLTNPISTSGIDSWTFHTYLNPRQNTEFFPLHLVTDTYSLTTMVSGGQVNYYVDSSLVGTVFPTTLVTGTWQHFATVKNAQWLHTFCGGSLVGTLFVGSGLNMSSSGSLVLNLFDGYYGLADQIVFEKQALWTDTLIKPNYLDEIYTFRTASEYSLNINFDISLDIESPTIIPKSPIPYQQLVCPSSGIEFEIVDDFSGVKWTQLLIQMNDITVWSGGNNMTEWFDDRGVLIYENLGQANGEWANIQLSPSGLEYTEGINRLLYPPGTVYSGSGAWGRRFTYYVPDSTEIGYFGTRMTITITGTDSIGYLSRFDDKFPNTFSGQYYFDFIPNDNIRYDDVFMHSGKSMRVDEMEARGIHFWVDLFDSNYPTTDIVEDECTISWSDGVDQFTCSGAWFTTWTGVTASGEDVFFHRMHWDPGNHWDWIGNRAIHLTVESHNNDPTCDVYNRQEYILFYGWQLGWWHQAVPGQIPPFDFNKKFPIFVSVKTYDFAPSRESKSYPLWSSPGYVCDLPVYIKPKPIPKEDLKVGILAQSQCLQYSEDVEVEVTCRDLDGNELVYSWTFRTEDEPN
jgi:hypothetical protein